MASQSSHHYSPCPSTVPLFILVLIMICIFHVLIAATGNAHTDTETTW